MYRELDKCTVYILNKLKNIKDRKTILLNTIFFRFFNLSGLYEMLNIQPFEELTPKIKETLTSSFNSLKSQGKPIFNNAYLISSGTKGLPKHISILEILSNLNLSDIISQIDNSKTPEESFNILKQIPMIGPFLACEIFTDLTYFKFFKQSWNDNNFVNICPGAVWGLEIIYNKSLSPKEQSNYLKHLYNLQFQTLPEINKTLNYKIPWKTIAYKKAFSNFPFLSITNLESALCEFRKYSRL